MPVCFRSIDLSPFFPLSLFCIFKLFLMFNYTRDFDAFDLRLRLPAVVSKLHKLINCNGGVTYIHCTAGLGRAPAVAVGLHATPPLIFVSQDNLLFHRFLMFV